MHWLFYSIVAIFTSAGYGITMRFVTKDTSAYLYSIAFTGVAFTLNLSILIYSYGIGVDIHYTLRSALCAMIGGIFLVGIDLGVIYMFKAGAPLGVGMSLVRVGNALMMALIGVAFFMEILTPVKILGIFFACTGIVLLSKPPRVVKAELADK